MPPNTTEENTANTDTNTNEESTMEDPGYVGTRSQYVLMSPAGAVVGKNPSGRATDADLASYWFLPCLEVMPNGTPNESSGGLGADKIRELIAAGEEVDTSEFNKVVVRPMIVSQGDPRTPAKGDDGWPLVSYTTTTANTLDVDVDKAFAGVARETARKTWCTARKDLGGRSYLDMMNLKISDEDQKTFDRMNAGRGAATKLKKDLKIISPILKWMSPSILRDMSADPEAVKRIKATCGSALTSDNLDTFCRVQDFTMDDRQAIVKGFFS